MLLVCGPRADAAEEGEGDAAAPAAPQQCFWGGVGVLTATRVPELTAKVADFGLSLPLGEGATHASQRFQGTPAYLAPEVGGMESDQCGGPGGIARGRSHATAGTRLVGKRRARKEVDGATGGRMSAAVVGWGLCCCRGLAAGARVVPYRPRVPNRGWRGAALGGTHLAAAAAFCRGGCWVLPAAVLMPSCCRIDAVLTPYC